MVDQSNDNPSEGFKRFAVARIVAAVVLIVGLIWALTVGLGYLSDYLPKPDTAPEPSRTRAADSDADHAPAPEAVTPPDAPIDTPVHTSADQGHLAEADQASTSDTPPEGHAPPGEHAQPDDGHDQGDVLKADASAHEGDQEGQIEGTAHPAPAAPQSKTQTQDAAKQGAHSVPKTTPAVDADHATADTQPKTAAEKPGDVHAETPPKSETTEAVPHEEEHLPPGVAFVQATIKPLEYELKQRWWGWRPNDIVNVTDNVNNYQLGVLEVTRRTIVQLAERISRTGSTDAFNPHLENAMNWIMVKADRYWFPSPESKYKESLDELAIYKHQLMNNEASFYTRADNVIPLLIAFEDLLGSCDENLVKEREKDGSKVGFFKSDNYFYYAKGITSAMAPILEALHHDFIDVLEKRNGAELLHHAIASCQRASKLNPWIVTNGDLDGILANHRANIAAPISHAKFYIGQLIKTLST
jgi:hypothetical protein